MTKPNLFREGDIVSIIAKVRFNVDEGENDAFLSVGYQSITVPVKELKLVQRSLRIGEYVALDDYSGCIGQVRALCDDFVWVKRNGGTLATYLSNALVPCDPPPRESPVLELSPDDKDDVIPAGGE